ncbi:hypothetical protein [Streptomyces cucumeris]|uniref:hypothetical protein n=1 Tax=Streptomyces cucumeris TaxID=2962890 RepID=UPI0020C87051|nr:hypothetical protein [Streptomyces sp. NEAU-Y11]
MPSWGDGYASSRWTHRHPDNVITHGSTEPILSVLDFRGFELRDLFLIGMNDNCGTLILPTEERAQEAARALRPGYTVNVEKARRGDDWWATYDRAEIDGAVGSHFITDLELKDGTIVIQDGRWI